MSENSFTELYFRHFIPREKVTATNKKSTVVIIEIDVVIYNFVYVCIYNILLGIYKYYFDVLCVFLKMDSEGVFVNRQALQTEVLNYLPLKILMLENAFTQKDFLLLPLYSISSEIDLGYEFSDSPGDLGEEI